MPFPIGEMIAAVFHWMACLNSGWRINVESCHSIVVTAGGLRGRWRRIAIIGLNWLGALQKERIVGASTFLFGKFSSGQDFPFLKLQTMIFSPGAMHFFFFLAQLIYSEFNFFRLLFFFVPSHNSRSFFIASLIPICRERERANICKEIFYDSFPRVLARLLLDFQPWSQEERE